jgi:hypothetical protein
MSSLGKYQQSLSLVVVLVAALAEAVLEVDSEEAALLEVVQEVNFNYELIILNL